MTTIVTLLLLGFVLLGAKALLRDEDEGEMSRAIIKEKGPQDLYQHRIY